MRLRFPAGTRGFTLVEILIAISIFLTVIFAIYSSFESGRATYGAGEQRADIQQSARIAMDLIEGDLRLAGYGFPKGAGNAITAATPTSITFIGDLSTDFRAIRQVRLLPMRKYNSTTDRCSPEWRG